MSRVIENAEKRNYRIVRDVNSASLTPEWVWLSTGLKVWEMRTKFMFYEQLIIYTNLHVVGSLMMKRMMNSLLTDLDYYFWGYLKLNNLHYWRRL